VPFESASSLPVSVKLYVPFLKGLKATAPGYGMKPGWAKPPTAPDSMLKGPTKVVVPSGQKRAIARCLRLVT